MQQTHFKKIFTVLLSLGFVFIFKTAAFANQVQCTTVPVINGTSAELTIKSVPPYYINWTENNVILAAQPRLISTSDIAPIKSSPVPKEGGDRTFTYTIVPGIKYSAYEQNVKTKQVQEIPSCRFTAPGTLMPVSGGAVTADKPKTPGGAVTSDNPNEKPVVDSTDTTSPQGLKLVIANPLGVKSIEEVIQKIMGVIVKLAIPVIICFFIYSGFMFITAQGDKKQLETAKTMFVQVVIGSVIILGAWTIASAIVSTVNLITG